MPLGRLTVREVTTITGYTRQAVLKIAEKEKWPIEWNSKQGGKCKTFDEQMVLTYCVRKGIQLPDDLVTPDPTTETKSKVLPFHEPNPHIDDSILDWWEEVPEKGRQVALSRYQAVQAWLKWREAERGNLDSFLSKRNREHSDQVLSRQSLLRWSRAYREGGIAGLVPGYYTRNANGPRIPERLKSYFDYLYLDQNQPTVTHCYRLTKVYAREEGISCPGCRSFRRHVDTIPQETLRLYREGNKAFYDSEGTWTVRDYGTLDSNHLWNSDHHQLDLMCTDESGKVVRPWLTVFQDVRSEICVGWCLSTMPNSTTIFLSFRRSVQAHGIPRELLIDNGKDYRSRDLAGGRTKEFKVEINEVHTHSLVDRLGIKVHFAIPYNARSKLAERMFKEVKEGFSKCWKTYCGGNIQERPERLATVLKRAVDVPTIHELEETFGQWIEDVHNQDACTREGMSRAAAHKQFLPKFGIRKAPEKSLALLCMRTSKPVKIRRHRVRAFNRWFESDDFVLMNGKWVHLLYDPMEIGHVFVQDLEGRILCEATQPQLLAWGATEQDYRREQSKKKREKQIAKAYRQNLIDEDIEPDPMKRSLEMGRKRARDNQKELDAIPEPAILPIAMEQSMQKVLQEGTEGGPPKKSREKSADEAVRAQRHSHRCPC